MGKSSQVRINSTRLRVVLKTLATATAVPPDLCVANFGFGTGFLKIYISFSSIFGNGTLFNAINFNWALSFSAIWAVARQSCLLSAFLSLPPFRYVLYPVPSLT